MASWLLLCLAGTAPARWAVVATTSGPIYQGHVRFQTNHLRLVNSDQDISLRLPVTNLTWIYFEPPDYQVFASSRDLSTNTWMEQDVGPATIKGDSRFEDEAVTIRSAGLGVQGVSDSFRFVFRPAVSNTEIVARVVSIHETSPGTRAGVMMRETLDRDSRCVMLGATPSRGGFFLFRNQQVAHPEVQPQPDIAAPYWLKLKREGDEFTAYKSRNGSQWMQAGKTMIPMANRFYVGMASASSQDYVLNWTTFDKVREGPYVMNPVFPPRAELVSGSMVVGWPVSLDTLAVDMRWTLGNIVVPNRQVARILFQWATPDWLAATRDDASAGAWLASGEFFEGDFRTVSEGRVKISSVLYGAKNLDANNEVVMISLNRGSIAPARYEIRTVNGSIWRAQSLSFGLDEISFKEPALGMMTIPAYEIAAIFLR